MSEQNEGQSLVYVGTYTGGESEGIYVYRMDPSSGALEFSSKATGIENPSFLDIDPSRRFLYAVAEMGPGKLTLPGCPGPVPGRWTWWSCLRRQPSEWLPKPGSNAACRVAYGDVSVHSNEPWRLRHHRALNPHYPRQVWPQFP